MGQYSNVSYIIPVSICLSLTTESSTPFERIKDMYFYNEALSFIFEPLYNTDRVVSIGQIELFDI